MTSKMLKYKVAVIGTGYWGKNLVRNFAQLEMLKGICDANLVTAEDLASKFQCSVLTWDQILKNPEIAGVAIAAPAEHHARLCREALLADKHVYVEKPLALDVGDAETLCQLAHKKNKILMVGHLLQYHPGFIKLREMVDQGQLGDIQYLYSNRLNLGKIRQEEDILWSFAPHDISMILSLVGDEPDSVESSGGYYIDKSIADVTTTHLSFPGGIKAHIFVSWLHPFKEQKLVVIGSKAMAVFDDGQDWPLKLKLYKSTVKWRNGQPVPEKSDPVSIDLPPSEPLKDECQHFLDCISEEKRPRTDGYEALRVLKVLDKATEKLQNNLKPCPKGSPKSQDYFVHESSYVDKFASIGQGTKIWHFCHISARAMIGENCVMGQNVMIGPEVTIGHNCKIQNNVSVYKGVTLEDGVFCGPSCVFTNVTTPRSEINRKNEFNKTYVERGVTIGANATIRCGVRLGAYSFIGAGAMVTKDVPAHALVIGSPARQIGWVSHAGEKLTNNFVCPREGRSYKVNKLGILEELVLSKAQ